MAERWDQGRPIAVTEMLVACPFCGQPAGNRCRVIRGKDPGWLALWPHRERDYAAGAPRYAGSEPGIRGRF